MYFEHLKIGKGKITHVHQGRGLTPLQLASDSSQCRETELWNKVPDFTFSEHS